MSNFEEELNSLLERTKNIKSPINATFVSSGISIDEYNKPSEIWINDVDIFYNKYLKNHPLNDRFKTLLYSNRTLSSYNKLVAALTSISNDKSFIDEMKGNHMTNGIGAKYDVFISHADKDKQSLIEDLYKSLNKLGISIFYDKESLEWGDNWKQRILDGVQKSEFAIIVISENFFGREWTEKELNELLSRQNKNGQKIILPILKGITIAQLQEKYPSIADIQALNSNKYSTDEIALKFAGQLIKRLKGVN
jgi:hypothetical protein